MFIICSALYTFCIIHCQPKVFEYLEFLMLYFSLITIITTDQTNKVIQNDVVCYKCQSNKDFDLLPRLD